MAARHRQAACPRAAAPALCDACGAILSQVSGRAGPLDSRGQPAAGAYNPCMFHALPALATTAVMERATLLANHVLASEPVAQTRLRAHAGRCMQLQFEHWPGLLPPLPPMAFRVTAAGLVEWCAEAPPDADLRIAVDASNPALLVARSLVGDRPSIEVAGDAAFAADVNWLFDNLRWDVEDDLARFVGAAPAREITRFGRAVATALRASVRSLAGLAARARGDTPDARDDGPRASS
jgi:ubiquinone biosynthesis protein UbiJ